MTDDRSSTSQGRIRRALWAGVLLLACSKTELAGSGSTGTGGAGPGGTAGTAAAGAGGGGGSAGMAGAGGSAGGGGAGGGDAGGAAGAGGAMPLACQGEYTACGCGCCGGVTPNVVCYYPEQGDSLAAIESADRAQAADAAFCATTGCTEGTRYLCCTLPVEDADATHQAQGHGSDVQRIEPRRTAGSRYNRDRR